MTAKRMGGQAALDFLMTYGWAIALVVIIAAVLFAIGVFDANNFLGSSIAGFSKVTVKGFSMGADGTFTMMLHNRAGIAIRVDNVSVAILNASRTIAGLPVNMAMGEDSPVLATTSGSFGAQPRAGAYSADIIITYTDPETGFQYTDRGTIRGKAP
jgi:hypothetical protein